MTEDFALAKHEKQGAVFQKLTAHYTAELATLRELNDDKSLDATATAYLRGRIRAIKDFLKLGEEPEATGDLEP
jgi:hypothetical protein